MASFISHFTLYFNKYAYTKETKLKYRHHTHGKKLNYPASAPKFILRKDLTLEIRTAIACQAYLAQTENSWGVITGLSRNYEVSRPFIYSLLNTFKTGLSHLLFPKKRSDKISRKVIEAQILAYRFEGRSSIDAISTLLKRDAMPLSAQGFISQFLTHVGKMLPNTMANENEAVKFVAFADDEVFSKSRPILITVDPVSSAILRIELTDSRTANKWSSHYQCILDNGFVPRLSTSDAGTALCAANKETLKDIPWQLDTFHSVAHRLGLWDRKLDKAIDTATLYAADCARVLDSAQSDAVIDKRFKRCFEADEAIKEARELQDHFHYLYIEIIHQLNSFDSLGELRKRKEAEETIEAALDLMASLKYNAINKDIASVRKALPDFLTYFETAETAVKNFQKLNNNTDALRALYLAWQWDKAVIKSKDIPRKHKAVEQRDLHLELAEILLEDEALYPMLKQKVYEELDKIIQASSMVECINSLLRPYLNNSRNQVSQEFLNTFMFYHNHRRYHAGKRKNKTPMEIVTGKEQKEDWIELLLTSVKKQESVLLA